MPIVECLDANGTEIPVTALTPLPVTTSGEPQSTLVIEGTFTAIGQSTSIILRGKFNFSANGFGTATILLERSFDNGVTFFATDTFTSDFSGIGEENEADVLYQLNCTAITASTIVFRLGSA